jgi:hypothetical protein
VTEALPLDCHGATFSECGRYRYRLRRTWLPELPPVLWIMLNPSTADAATDDPTIRRCMRFAQRWGGFGGLEVCNLFALRSTDPKALRQAADPVGPDNDRAILEASKAAGCVVVAWGAGGELKGRGRIVARALSFVRADLVCLGRTQRGHPLHPLYVPYETELIGFAGYE